MTLSSSLLSDFSISGTANDQLLVYTPTLNKWAPYTLTGVIFNDTTKTTTVSGIASLSGLTTDVAISSPANNQTLVYNSGTAKWNNALNGLSALLYPPEDNRIFGAGG